MNRDDILLEAEMSMEKSVDYMVHEFAAVRTGKASPGLVENVDVHAYGSTMKLKQLALITTPEANGAHDDLMQLDIDSFSFEPFAERIWELRHNVTSYDAWYIALAEALKLPLATLDDALSKSNGVACEFLTPGL